VTVPVVEIKAAMSVARDLAEGQLSPAQMAAELEAHCRELFGQVIGPDDPLWELQVRVARGVLALGGIPANEIAEWLAVIRATEAAEQAMPPGESWIEQALALLDDEESV